MAAPVICPLTHTTNMLVVAQAVPPNQPPNITDQASSFVVWVIVGLAFLWAISFMAETTMIKLRPVLMFIVVAAFVGVLVMHIFAKL